VTIDSLFDFVEIVFQLFGDLELAFSVIVERDLFLKQLNAFVVARAKDGDSP